MVDNVWWEPRGTITDFQKIIDHHKAEEQREADKIHTKHTTIHKASEFLSSDTHEKRRDEQ